MPRCPKIYGNTSQIFCINIFLSIDGCRAGLAAVEITFTSNLESWEFYIFLTIKDVYEKYFKACLITKPHSNLAASLRHEHSIKQILVDIPIGLKEADLEEKKCDILNRLREQIFHIRKK
ncbi:MAG: hypothetical protein IMZ41_02680 [Actinobacteria bacterium]|nr:hypothetical protein [Actinomycetota bacterium]